MPPDPVTAVVALLRSRLPVGATVGTVIPPELPPPFVHVATVTGQTAAPSWRGGPTAETATLGLTCWAGPDTGHARTLARTVVAALVGARSVPVPGGVLVAVRHTAGPVHVPDPAGPDTAHRYVVTVAATVH